MLDRLFTRLENVIRILPRERQDLIEASGHPQSHATRDIVLMEGMPLGKVGVVLSGFLCHYKTLSDGRRQILSCLLPGDIFNLQGLFFDKGECGIVALAPSSLAYLNHAKLRRMLCQPGNLMSALWWSLSVEQAIAREWLMNTGKRTALERMAHFLCEMAARAGAVGLVLDGESSMPATQDDLADILGLSSVHVNRTLQALRRDKLISLSDRRLRIHDLPRLQQIGLFDSDYLQLTESSDVGGDGLSQVFGRPSSAGGYATA